MKKIWLSLPILVLILSNVSVAGNRSEQTIEGNSSSWQTIVDSQHRGDIQTPCGSKNIPYNESRRARGISLGCDGGVSSYTRFAEKFDAKEWYKLESIHDREGMQKLRQDSSDVSWGGKIPYRTIVSWSWTAHMRGQNSRACGYHKESATCSQDKYRTVNHHECHEVYDPPSDTGGSGRSGGSDSGGSSNSGGGGGYEHSDSPYGAITKPLTLDDPRVAKLQNKKNEPNILAQVSIGLLNAIVPKAEAHEECSDSSEEVFDHTDYWTCYDTVASTCDFDNEQTGSMFCQDQTLNYTARFEKPDASWAPGKDKSYLDYLPNKYDLMPGEYEKINIASNSSNLSTVLSPKVQIDNAWNEYYAPKFNPARIACEFNSKQALEISIQTKGRILRKAPNALALPVDRNGSPKDPLKYNSVVVGTDDLKGHPYEMRLVDTSNTFMMSAARQSRAFDELKADSKTETVQNKTPIGTMQSQGFWKDTQFRLRLLQENGKLQRDIVWTDPVHTDSSYIQANDDDIKVPLEGAGGVTGLYHPSGHPFLVGWLFGTSKFDQVELTPGKNYEVRVSMYQRGIPFYKTGCKNNAMTCENEKANDDAFSDELAIKFTADERVDERTSWEHFLAFQRAGILKKIKYVFTGKGI